MPGSIKYFRKKIIAAIIEGGFNNFTTHLYHFNGPTGSAFIQNEVEYLTDSETAVFGGVTLQPSDTGYGTGLSFPGNTGSYCWLKRSNFDTQDEWTVEITFRTPTPGATQMVISKGAGFQVYTAGGQIGCSLSDNNQTGNYFTGNSHPLAIQANVNYKVAVQRSSDGKYKLFVNGNGVSMGVSTKKPSTGGSFWCLGKYAPNNNLPFQGLIEEVRITHKALYIEDTLTYSPSSTPFSNPSSDFFTASGDNHKALHITTNDTIENIGNVKPTNSAYNVNYATFDSVRFAKVAGTSSARIEFNDHTNLRPGAGDFGVSAKFKTTQAGAYTIPILSQYSQDAQAGSWILGVREAKLYVWYGNTSFVGTTNVGDNNVHTVKFGRVGDLNVVLLDGKVELMFRNTYSLGVIGQKFQTGQWGTNPPVPAADDMYVADIRFFVGYNPYSIQFRSPVTGAQQDFFNYDSDQLKDQVIFQHDFDVNATTTIVGTATNVGASISNNGPSWGSCLTLTGSGRLELGTVLNQLSGVKDFTIEMLFRRDSNNTSFTLIGNRNGPGNTTFALALQPALACSLWPSVSNDNGLLTISSGFVPVVGVTYHVSVMRSKDFMIMFLNGQVIGWIKLPDNFSAVNPGTTTILGQNRYNSVYDQGFIGNIDTVRITTAARLPTK